MKRKTILKVVGVLVMAGGLAVLMGFVHRKQSKVICKSLDIVIPGGQYLITRGEIRAIVDRADSAVLGHPINVAGLRNLEKAIRESPYVADASVYAGVNGMLNVEVTQRQPLVRIINERSHHFYLDRQGHKMPLSPNYTPRVLVASGHIDEPFRAGKDSLETALGKDILKLARFIEKDAFWRAQIGQIYVNSGQEIELIPRVGDHRILIGGTEGLSSKMEKLLIFYRKAMPRVGWDTYKVINLKYGNQIVASREPEN